MDKHINTLKRTGAFEIVVELVKLDATAQVAPQELVDVLCQLVADAIVSAPEGGDILIAAASRQLDGKNQAALWVSDGDGGVRLPAHTGMPARRAADLYRQISRESV